MSQDKPVFTGISRRALLKGAGLLAGCRLIGTAFADPAASPTAQAAASPASAPETPPQGYNILLITSDQERYFDLYPFPVPGRERLMKSGTTFTRHHINSCVCTSSRSVMYTGLHMPQTKMFDNAGMPWMPWSLDPALGTVATMIKHLGYYAAYKGKWHLSTLMNNSLKGVPSHNIDDIDHAALHQSMQRYGFEDYSGIGDLIGLRQGGMCMTVLPPGRASAGCAVKAAPCATSSSPGCWRSIWLTRTT